MSGVWGSHEVRGLPLGKVIQHFFFGKFKRYNMSSKAACETSNPGRNSANIDLPNRLKICYFGPPGVSRGVWSAVGRLGEGSRRFSGASWGPPGAPWGRLGASWGRLGAPRGPLGRSWGRLGLVLGRPGAILGGLGRVLARSLGVLGGIVVNLQKPTKTLGKSRILGVPGASWGVLGASWSVLGASWGPLAASWGPPGGVLGQLGPLLGRLGRVLRRLGRVLGCLGASWARPGRIWARRGGVGAHPIGRCPKPSFLTPRGSDFEPTLERNAWSRMSLGGGVPLLSKFTIREESASATHGGGLTVNGVSSSI